MDPFAEFRDSLDPGVLGDDAAKADHVGRVTFELLDDSRLDPTDERRERILDRSPTLGVQIQHIDGVSVHGSDRADI